MKCGLVRHIKNQMYTWAQRCPGFLVKFLEYTMLLMIAAKHFLYSTSQMMRYKFQISEQTCLSNCNYRLQRHGSQLHSIGIFSKLFYLMTFTACFAGTVPFAWSQISPFRLKTKSHYLGPKASALRVLMKQKWEAGFFKLS